MQRNAWIRFVWYLALSMATWLLPGLAAYALATWQF